MTSLPNVLYALAWFVLGVIVGAQWTRMRGEVRRIANAQAGEEHVAPQQETEQTPPKRARTRRWARRVLDAFVVLLFISSAVQAYLTNEQIQAVVDCQNGYQAGFADALDARSKTSQEAQQSLDDLMTTIGSLATGVATPENRQRFVDALASYLQKRAEAKKQQQEHPYPPSPRDVCK